MSTTPPNPSAAPPVPAGSAPPASLSAQVSDQTGSIAKPSASRLSFRDPRDAETRRPSIQFSVHQSESLLRSESPKGNRSKGLSRRLSSPPPPSTYEPRVSFDTFNNQDASSQNLALKVTNRHYASTRRSRTFLCGIDQNDYSEFALEWLLEELVDDGDEVVCLRVLDKDTKLYNESSLEQGRYKVEAQKLMDHIQAKMKDDEKSISLILEFCVGKVQDMILQMIEVYEPACLIVGTRGKSLNGIQGLLPGSVSKYCLQNSPIPVIVVRPESKREKKKRKRKADPSRKAYFDILERSGGRGTPILDKVELESAEQEAWEVAKAIGIPTEYSASTILRRASAEQRGADGLHRVTSTRSDATSGPETPSPTGPLSPDFPDAQSPEPLELDSPDSSSDEDEKSRDTSPDEVESNSKPVDALKLGSDAV